MGMVQRQGWSLPKWANQLAVVVGYIALFAIIRPFSDAHWSLTAGLRLCALLLLPTRYWLALAVGDVLFALPFAIRCEHQFGLPWAMQYSFPLTALAMPLVWWCKEKLELFPAKRLVNFQALIVCIISCAGVWSLYNYGGILIGSKDELDSMLLLGSLFTGSYVALLTIVPWVIMAKLDYKVGTLQSRLRNFAKSPMALDAGLCLFPALLILSWLTYRSPDADKPVWALFMFAPVAWLTLRYGWRAAVLGGTATVASICLLFKWDGNVPDANVVQVQAIIAFAITCLIALGARITAMNRAEEQERVDAKQAMKLARQSMRVSEARLRKASETLESVCGELQINQNRLLTRFRMMLPANESLSYTKQAALTQEKVYQIAEAMHPIAWRKRGLPAALRENIGRALDEIGVAFQCRLTGSGLSNASTSLHTMLYRFACEAVVYTCGNLDCTTIKLLLRGGNIDGHRLVVLRVEGVIDPGIQHSHYIPTGQTNRLTMKLGASGLDLIALRDQVRLFNGEMHVQTTENKIRITALLADEKEREPKAPSRLRLWAG